MGKPRPEAQCNSGYSEGLRGSMSRCNTEEDLLVSSTGHKDLPEEEELGHVQLPAVLLPVRHASDHLREPV